VTFKRTTDLALVREIMAHPRLYEWYSDDGSPAREDYRPIEHEGVWYILAIDEGTLLGVWMLVPRNAIEYEIHTCLLPGHGYRRGRRAAQEAAVWIWQNTPARRLITAVPAFNRIAYKFAIDAGFELVGVDRQSFLKHGTLYDQAILGLSRPEQNQCQ
jgi:RimJ/RimL family protein N-acetyltransferase